MHRDDVVRAQRVFLDKMRRKLYTNLPQCEMMACSRERNINEWSVVRCVLVQRDVYRLQTHTHTRTITQRTSKHRENINNVIGPATQIWL